MADVSIKYKNATVAEMSAKGTKTLKTSGKYCEGDIAVTYVPPAGETVEVNVKSYDITLAKSSGWVLLLTLDDEVLSHINDESFGVMLYNKSTFSYVNYAGNCYTAGNNPIAMANGYPVYGYASRNVTEAKLQTGSIFYPANSTTTSTSLDGFGQFRLSGNEFYLKPSDGFIREGTYRILFTW